MKQLINIEYLATNPLVSRFLENPNQPFTDNELEKLVNLHYEKFLNEPFCAQLNLIQFLSRINHVSGLYSLSQQLPIHQLQDMIRAKDYYAFRIAAEGGYLKVLQYFVDLLPNLMQKMIKADYYCAFRWVAANGYLEALQYLVELSPSLVPDMIKAHVYYAFRYAANNGKLEVLKYLVELAPDLLQDMIKANDYDAFRLAAFNGFLEVLKYLVAAAPELLQEIIKSYDYAVFRSAAYNGYLEVLQYLVTLAPNLVQDMTSAKDYAAFRWLLNRQISTVLYLDACFPVQLTHNENLIQQVEGLKQKAARYKALVSNNMTFFKGERDVDKPDLIDDVKEDIAKFGAALINKEFHFTSAESLKPFLGLK